uniref:Uncharacterized protein n=1 Tax=Glossina pallidipes TaxID=7398 RepID=A0A1B0AEB7_GLOPL
MTPSQAAKERETSFEKSTCPGVSIKFSKYTSSLYLWNIETVCAFTLFLQIHANYVRHSDPPQFWMRRPTNELSVFTCSLSLSEEEADVSFFYNNNTNKCAMDISKLSQNRLLIESVISISQACIGRLLAELKKPAFVELFSAFSVSSVPNGEAVKEAASKSRAL